jgi:hypothetical protein
MTEILQGDLMFTDDTSNMDIDGVKHITFQPNTILYAVETDSEIGKDIQKAKIGIVWHTTYSGNTIEDLKWQDSLGASAVGAGFKTYLNTYTRAGTKLPKGSKAVKLYQAHFTNWWNKNKGDNDVQKSKLRAHLKVINSSLSTLENVVDFMQYLVEAKLMIVKKMDSATGIAKTFVKTNNGLKVVAPEGYVAIDKTGGAVKIVDKMEFSFNNFTVAKNWDK